MDMDRDWQSRTDLLLGDTALHKLGESHLLLVGLGGVGGYAAEALGSLWSGADDYCG